MRIISYMGILQIIFPKFCAGCGKFNSYLCSECQRNLIQRELFCPVCEKNSIGGLTHPLCRKKYCLDGVWSLGVYQDPLRKLIQKLKYKWVKEIGEVLVDLMIDYWAHFDAYFLTDIQKDRGSGWVITSVPLHQHRKNSRGYNQSEVLGRLLAEKLGLKYQNLLVRDKKTKSQVGLDLYQRRKNIRGAFSLNPNLRSLDPNVLLIDDVWTTGATLKECGYILKRAGVKKVWAITVAC